LEGATLTGAPVRGLRLIPPGLSRPSTGRSCPLGSLRTPGAPPGPGAVNYSLVLGQWHREKFPRTLGKVGKRPGPSVTSGSLSVVEVVTTQEHRILSFVSACLGSGYAPTVDEVETWLASPRPTPEIYSGAPWSGVTSVLAASIPFRGRLEQSAEPAVAHLVRIGWLVEDVDRVSLSPLGHAMYAAAERSDVIVSGPIVVRLGTDDPLAYPTLFAELGRAGQGLLVDPYLGVEQLNLIVQQTQLSRILLKETPATKANLVPIEVYLTGAVPRSIDVRVTTHRAVHDRLILWDDQRTVEVMGSSVNTVQQGTGTVITPMPEVVAGALRQEVETWWGAAIRLPRTQALPPEVADASLKARKSASYRQRRKPSRDTQS